MITKGQIINDRYEIIKSIGEGGMANVYLADDKVLHRKVAIKVLRGDLANDEKFIRRFQREAHNAALLSHPNIVEMYDVGEDNGTYYIVMEYVEGRTLKQLLKKRGALTVSEVIDIMLQLTDGINYAHDKYIIHRDLKPQNIMISDDGKIKITDFGIAMALNSTQLTQTNSVMGSVHYLPPEQASGKGSTIKSDIYSMGIMLYELLTGKLPFKGDTAVEIALKHMKDPIPSVRKTNPNISQTLENIVLKSTAKNPKNRYDDVKEMYNDLKNALNDDKTDVKPYVYKYPEHELDEKDTVLREVKDDEAKEEPVAKQVVEKKKKSISGIIIAILCFIFLAGIGLVVFMLLPAFQGVKNETIPDVSNLTIPNAEKALTNLEFVVEDETIKEYSDTIEKGKVIGTQPEIGRVRAKGTKIKLIESLGKNDIYKIEDYVGKNYIEVQTTLEKVYKMNVIIEKKEVDITEDMDLQKIIDQDLKPGTEVIISDENPQKIILYVPDAYEQYPDFVAEGWQLSEIEEFAKKYNLALEIKYVGSNEYPEGTIIKQSRTGKIVDGVSLIITVTKKDDIAAPANEDDIINQSNKNNNQDSNKDSSKDNTKE